MPFMKTNVSERIEHMRETDASFKKAWDESRAEYKLIGEMISLRKKELLRMAKEDMTIRMEPNADTYAAMETAEKNDVYGPFDSVSDLMEALNT